METQKLQKSVLPRSIQWPVVLSYALGGMLTLSMLWNADMKGEKAELMVANRNLAIQAHDVLAEYAFENKLVDENEALLKRNASLESQLKEMTDAVGPFLADEAISTCLDADFEGGAGRLVMMNDESMPEFTFDRCTNDLCYQSRPVHVRFLGFCPDR